ncbi:MAG: UDP-N-acetylmuramoyl-L-alanine--D-glutamate ligase [Candidatus Nanopelagicaceae bacterium]|nr:UDP-N-acetylmuramoyl-L-alanine--D-glutamate ligase [Candidatus Nanopelagicaceae bacterium]
MRKTDIAHAKVLVIGAGVTGSSVAQVLRSLGSEIHIFDENQRADADEGFISLESALQGAWSFAVVSPGWRQDHPLTAHLMSQGTRVLSEIDLAWILRSELLPLQTWLAVTGTNGKTTTVELATAMLLEGGLKAKACGNVGETVIEAVINGDRMDYLVLELSSFQLQWSNLPEFKSVAILNIADDHVDWHGSFENYVAAKLRILDRADLAILNGDDSRTVEAVEKWEGRKVFFSLNSPKPGELGVVDDLLVDRSFVLDTNEAELIAQLDEVHPRAPHSISNTLAAAGLARSVGVSHQMIRQAAQNFIPGRHRIETVMESDGITWVNDSKATNPHAATASLASYHSIVWIAGGLAKGASMTDLVRRSKGHIKAVILIGRDRELIAKALSEAAPEIPYLRADKDPTGAETLMEHVVLEAMKIAKAGDVVLLAPACASMDQFISYADRGDQFAAAVKKLVGPR